jgi:hypothetical protein
LLRLAMLIREMRGLPMVVDQFLSRHRGKMMMDVT